jgi:hypothetical protein
MNAKYGFSRFVKIIILFLCVGGTFVLYYDYSIQKTNFFWICFLISGAYLALCCIYSFLIEMSSEKIEAFYVVGKKKFFAYSCRFGDIRRIVHMRGAYLLERCSGKPNPVLVPTGIDGYREILKTIVENAPQAIIEPSAKKKLIKDKILSAE